MLAGFISQAIFVRILNVEYLGLNGLFTDVLTMLSFFELGIGSAIIYNLYVPVSRNDIESIKSLMRFYKKAYNLIAVLILGFGLLLIGFIPTIVGEINVDINIYAIYMLFLVSTISTYLLSYKKSILYAYQKNYIINIIHIVYTIILNVLQLVLLFITKNYYMYLVVKILCQFAENIIITNIANKKYSYLKEKSVKSVDKNVEKNIFSKVKGLIFHKVGNAMVNGTDNIIISYFLGVSTVGLYSNYRLIINSVSTLFNQIISANTAGIGNLLITETKEKCFIIFKRIRFLNFWIAAFSGICIFIIIQPFIKIWVGKEYLLPLIVVFVLVFNYFQKTMRSTYNTFKDSAGIWIEDKFVPVIESTLNIIFSVVLLKFFGLAGVFMGTIISGLSLWCYSYPKFVYKKLFNRKYIDYAKETIGYIMLFLVLLVITYFVSLFFIVNNIFLQIIINILICLIVPNILLILIYMKSDNFKYFMSLLKNILKKIFNKIILK